MIEAIELQVISRILTSDSTEEVNTLCNFGTEYYSVYKEHAEYILNHLQDYGDVPDVFTFQAQFPDINLVKVSEPLDYLVDELNKNRQHILLVETFNKLKSLGSGDVTDAWNYLSMQCDKIAELTSSDPMDIIHDAKKRADQVVEFSKQTRIPTGFPEIDKLMYGGLSTVEELLLIVARTNTGKAQPLWSKVLTPTGWTTMGQLKIGDVVVGKNNDNGRVIHIFPQGVKYYYRVRFDDGTFVECCDDHLWEVTEVTYHGSSKHTISVNVLTTRYIRHNISLKEYYVPVSTAIRSPDLEQRRAEVERFFRCYVDKLFDGSVNKVSVSDKSTAETVADLARSVGLKSWISENSNSTWFVYCQDIRFKKIVSIEPAGRTECQCILLDNMSHTYLTDNYTVTHNSWVCTRMMETSQKNGFPVLYYSPEMQASYLGTRFDTWRAHFQNSQLYQGKYTPQYLEYIDELQKEPTSAFILEDKNVASGVVNTSVIENLVKKHKIKEVIIDGLSYMEDVRKASSDYERYKNLCLDLFKISKKHNCAIVIAMQANRETKDNKDDKGDPFPNLMNVEGSDHPGRIATQAFALRQIFDKHVLDIRLEKSRIANNQKPVLSYAWDVNTGNMQYLPGGEDDPTTQAISTPTVTPKIVNTVSADKVSDDISEEDFDENVEF